MSLIRSWTFSWVRVVIFDGWMEGLGRCTDFDIFVIQTCCLSVCPCIDCNLCNCTKGIDICVLV